MQKIVVMRYHKTTEQVEGLKWVLYKKEQCESVTTRLLELLDQLEKFVEPQSKLEELTQALGIHRCDPRLEDTAKQARGSKPESTKVTMSATQNLGIMMGVNMGTLSGLSFGTSNTVTNQLK
ncbi:uncharacterized protein DNG_05232 [Cephalotrichum gorgonifer]|uniref:Uncharacterized protein n=1 Tax=Cephalotrichum gorgonifer TaxID=2041049 RepID=A0AAE8MZJ6_9PEZI|nr:uncharacterized protein DNG_05232 [Cephalotrichum gorgonifer]